MSKVNWCGDTTCHCGPAGIDHPEARAVEDVPWQRKEFHRFLDQWFDIDEMGRGAGKTFFWASVISYILNQDEWVREELLKRGWVGGSVSRDRNRIR